MPPDLPIAGGANLSGVRDHVRWVPLSVSPTSSLSSVDTDTDSDSDFSNEDLDLPTTGSFSSVGSGFPPSPPVAVTAKKSGDYFSTTSSAGKTAFLHRVFPNEKLSPVTVHSDDFNLALVEQSGKRTLYVEATFAQVNMRENLVALLDMADEELECDTLVVVLDKEDDRFALTLHSLMYVGGSVIAQDAAFKTQAAANYILVGIDLA